MFDLGWSWTLQDDSFQEAGLDTSAVGFPICQFSSGSICWAHNGLDFYLTLSVLWRVDSFEEYRIGWGCRLGQGLCGQEWVFSGWLHWSLVFSWYLQFRTTDSLMINSLYNVKCLLLFHLFPSTMWPSSTVVQEVFYWWKNIRYPTSSCDPDKHRGP